MVKRFNVTGVTRDKVYDLTKGTKGSHVLYFSCNPNGESEVLTLHLKPLPKLKKLQFDFDFSTLAIKGRASIGNILSKYPVRKIVQKEKGVSTLGARAIWFDDVVQRLNADGRGTYLGEFMPNDKILAFTKSGYYRLHGFDLSTHFEPDMLFIEKYDPQKLVTVVFFDGATKEYFAKRFTLEPSDKKTLLISDAEGSFIYYVSTEPKPVIHLKFSKAKDKEVPDQTVKLAEAIPVKGQKTKPVKLSSFKIKSIDILPPEEEAPKLIPPTPEERAARFKAMKEQLDQTELEL
jgi:topoisomerase-4 subunit A